MEAHMKTILLSAALASAMILSGTASAQALRGPSVTVTTKDLDLRTEAGRKTLGQRLFRAALEVCPEPEVGITPTLEHYHCIRETLARARRAADVAIARANGGPVADTALAAR